MNKKKKVLIVAMMIIAAMISGCKEKEDNKIKEKKSVSYSPTKEIQCASESDGKIQIKDKVYELPIKYTDLEEIDGFELENKDAQDKLYGKIEHGVYYLDVENTYGDDDFYGSYGKDGHDYVKANINGIHMVIGIASMTDPYGMEKFKLEDAMVDSISVISDDTVSEDNNFIYAMKGISLADTRESVLIKTENPNEYNIDDEEYIQCAVTDALELADIKIKFKNYESVQGIEVGVSSEPRISYEREEKKECSWNYVFEYKREIEVTHEKIAKELHAKKKLK